MATKKAQDTKSTGKKDKKDLVQDKSMSIYFSPQQQKDKIKNNKQNMEESFATTGSTVNEDVNKELITVSQLQASFSENLAEIKNILMINTAEIKNEIKQEMFKLTVKIQNFEDQISTLDFHVNTLKDDNVKIHQKIQELELKIHEMEDRSRQNNLRFRNFEEKGTQENLKQMLHQYFLALNIPIKDQDQPIK
ncbi:Hypothetical predicted protein [Pelobates cultripes]|uniref:Uncharacterized protein n=1 Tax=Pelobates cultripes TaxID=61616 RepID=A0AAD1TAT8_PELCU|nr:Hypothetical predicted protein [Pelobates cultripes]